MRVSGREQHHARKRDDRYQSFEHHRAVANDAPVGFPLELFGRGARSDHGVESRTCAARDGHEQNRKERHVLGRVPTDERRILHGVAAEENAERRAPQSREQEIATEMTARLQEQPHRGNGSYKAITQQRHIPYLDGLLVADAEERSYMQRQPLTGPERWAQQRREDQ